MRARQLLLELTNALRTVSERWLIVGICAAVGLGVGAGAVLLATPMYQGTSTVTISFRDIEQGNESDQEMLLTKQQLRAFAEMAERPQVTERTLELVPDADTDSPSVLADRLTARVLPNSYLLELSVLDPNPETAGKLGGAAGSVLAAEIADLDSPQFSASASDIAQVSGPEVPPVLPWLGFGLLAGAIAGVAGLLVAERLDPSIRNAATLSAATELPNLAVISADSSADLEPTILRLRPSMPRCEEFRQLRSSLQFVDRGRPHRRMLVTSAGPQEGRTTTACNLALTMARAGQRVLLLEGDLNAPRLGDYLDLDPERGLTGVLIGRDEPESVLQQVPDVGPGRLEVMVAGALPSDPASTSELLRSRGMKFVFQALDARADVIIVDAPALSSGPEAVALASRCDVTMLVVRHGHTSRRALRQALEAAEDPGVRLLGTVLVMAPAPSSGASGSGETSTEYPAVASGRGARAGRGDGHQAGPTSTTAEARTEARAEVAAAGAGGGPAAGTSGAGGAAGGVSGTRGGPLGAVPAGGLVPGGAGRAGGDPYDRAARDDGATSAGYDRGAYPDVDENEPTISSRSGRRRRAVAEDTAGYGPVPDIGDGVPSGRTRRRPERSIAEYAEPAGPGRPAEYPVGSETTVYSDPAAGYADAARSPRPERSAGAPPARPSRPSRPDRRADPDPAPWPDPRPDPRFAERRDPRAPAAHDPRSFDSPSDYPDPVSYFASGGAAERGRHPGYEQPGYEQAGYDERGYGQGRYDREPGQRGYGQDRYDHGYDQGGYRQDGYRQDGYRQDGYRDAARRGGRPDQSPAGYREQSAMPWPPDPSPAERPYPGADTPYGATGRPDQSAYPDQSGYPGYPGRPEQGYPGYQGYPPAAPDPEQRGRRARSVDPEATPERPEQPAERPHRGGHAGRRRRS